MDRDPLYVASATGVDVALPIAGTGSRSYAFLIDWHIRLVVALAWFLAAAVLSVGSPRNLANATPFAALMMSLPPALLYLLYHPVLEIAMRGRTPGKRIAGVRLVTRDGGTPSLGALLVRNLFRLVDSLPMFYVTGIVATFLTRDHVRIGDMAAGTVLVHDGASAVAALDVLAGVARDTAHDPALIDLAQDVLRRWNELQPKRRVELARGLLQRLGAPPTEPAEPDEGRAILAQLRAALRSAGGA